MKKYITKINFIIWICIVFLFWFSWVSGARVYLEPSYTWFIKNCPSNLDIMIDTQGEKAIAWDFILYFNTGEIKPISFLSGNFFWWGGELQVEGNNIIIIGFNGEGVKWKWKFWSLVFESIGDSEKTSLSFKSSEGKIGSHIAKDDTKELPTIFGGGEYYFYTWTCWSATWAELKIKSITEITETYKQQIKVIMEAQIQKQKMKAIYNKIFISLWVVLILLVLIIILKQKKMIFKSRNTI